MHSSRIRHGSKLLLRAMLVDATGGRLYYEELWDAAMDHAHDIINHMPEVQKAGGVPLDIDHMCEVFGALVYYYEAPERRSICNKALALLPRARSGGVNLALIS